MRHRGANIIEDPQAYQNAITRSIHARANAKRWTAWKAAHPHLAAWVEYNEPAMVSDDDGVTYRNNPSHRPPLGWLPKFIHESIEKWGAPSEKATVVFQRIFDERTEQNAKRAEERAAEALRAEAWKPGRQVIEGIVISIKSVPGYTRWASDTYKMLVKRDDSSRIYVSIPAQINIPNDELKGKRVRFTATVEPKAEEPTFAFGSRPTKGEVITITAEEAK